MFHVDQGDPPMSENFMWALKHTLAEEGVFQNHEYDPGGKTKYGITERTWAAYRQEQSSAGVNAHALPVNVGDISVEHAKEVYWTNYWLPLSLDRIPNKFIAAEVFDSAVNCGPVTAAKFLQAALNYVRVPEWSRLTEDGAIGPMTRNAIRITVASGYLIPLLIAMNGEQYIHYKAIGNQHFSRGWTRRLALAKDIHESE